MEGLRGFAALSVFFSHILNGSVGSWHVPAWCARLWPMQAAEAVMVFFCLSGYVIGLNYHEEPGPPPAGQVVRSYLWKRFLRLMPVNFIAVMLACAVAASLDWTLVLTNLFFLQNYCDYAGKWIFVLETNSNLWSLNYEVLFYLLFIPILLYRPRLWIVGATALAIALLGWYTPYVPVFAACYAAGFLFWLAGLALARHTAPVNAGSSNWPTCLLLAFVTWKVQFLRHLLAGYPTPYFLGPIVTLYALDFLPVAVWLLAAVARRDVPYFRFLKLTSALIPLGGFLCVLRKTGALPDQEFCFAAGIYVLALALWWWKPSLLWFRWLAPVGAISFALYALSRPIQEWVFRNGQSLPSTLPSYLLCAGVVTVMSVLLACYVDLRLGPQIKQAWGAPPGSASRRAG